MKLKHYFGLLILLLIHCSSELVHYKDSSYFHSSDRNKKMQIFPMYPFYVSDTVKKFVTDSLSLNTPGFVDSLSDCFGSEFIRIAKKYVKGNAVEVFVSKETLNVQENDSALYEEIEIAEGEDTIGVFIIKESMLKEKCDYALFLSHVSVDTVTTFSELS